MSPCYQTGLNPAVTGPGRARCPRPLLCECYCRVGCERQGTSIIGSVAWEGPRVGLPLAPAPRFRGAAFPLGHPIHAHPSEPRNHVRRSEAGLQYASSFIQGLILSMGVRLQPYMYGIGKPPQGYRLSRSERSRGVCHLQAGHTCVGMH